ncbi:hypothetical protein TPA0598_05_02740 [Streptomyces lydicamycinicus]|uniref:Uncharacterized protein n=1 Tax=Streptomyces lydicamycinicus TaxID=1546107 RepID=A0A0P4R9I2_9ACTN|nr:hypothetical protein TPA0598_05_02740 [Streptomyces lydicamycinicus]
MTIREGCPRPTPHPPPDPAPTTPPRTHHPTPNPPPDPAPIGRYRPKASLRMTIRNNLLAKN